VTTGTTMSVLLLYVFRVSENVKHPNWRNIFEVIHLISSHSHEVVLVPHPTQSRSLQRQPVFNHLTDTDKQNSTWTKYNAQCSKTKLPCFSFLALHSARKRVGLILQRSPHISSHESRPLRLIQNCEFLNVEVDHFVHSNKNLSLWTAS